MGPSEVEMILCAKRPGGFPSKFIELIIEGLGHFP